MGRGKKKLNNDEYQARGKVRRALVLKLAVDGLNQTEIARKVGITQPRVSQILRAAARIKRQPMLRMNRAPKKEPAYA